MGTPITASRITGLGTFEFVSIEAPRPGLGQVLVRPLVLSLCGSDVFMLHYERFDSYPRSPGTTGHEMIGVVEELGDGVVDIEPGVRALVLSPDHTAMAELFVADRDWVFPLPDSRPIGEYLMAQQLGTVLYASRRLPSVVGKTVVVIGQGSAGLFFVSLLRRFGATKIIAMDIVESRVDFSRRFGADEVFNNRVDDPEDTVAGLTGNSMADILVEAAGETSSINLAPKLVKKGGTILYFGIPRAHTFEFDFMRFFRSYATTVSCSGAMLEPREGSFALAIRLIQEGAIDVSGMLTHSMPLSRLGDAYELARTKADGSLKVAVAMPGSGFTL